MEANRLPIIVRVARPSSDPATQGHLLPFHGRRSRASSLLFLFAFRQKDHRRGRAVPQPRRTVGRHVNQHGAADDRRAGRAWAWRMIHSTRTGEGRARAKARGQHMGRPPEMTAAQKQDTRRRRKDGESVADPGAILWCVTGSDLLSQCLRLFNLPDKYVARNTLHHCPINGCLGEICANQNHPRRCIRIFLNSLSGYGRNCPF